MWVCIQIIIYYYLRAILSKGPFKYYVIKKVGGWVRPNAYVCLQGGWVGVAKCLRNHKNFLKKSKLTSNKDCMSLQIFEVKIHTR